MRRWAQNPNPTLAIDACSVRHSGMPCRWSFRVSLKVILGAFTAWLLGAIRSLELGTGSACRIMLAAWRLPVDGTNWLLGTAVRHEAKERQSRRTQGDARRVAHGAARAAVRTGAADLPSAGRLQAAALMEAGARQPAGLMC